MSRPKKVKEEVAVPISAADCTEYVSIAFDKNSNLYGVTKFGELFRYDFITREWKPV